MKAPDARNPVAIEAGLDCATIQLLVEHEQSWEFAMVFFVVALSAVACASLEWWAAAIVLGIGTPAALRAAPTTQTSRAIELQVDRLGVVFRGERIAASADYFGVDLGTLRFEVVGGLTKAEHARLEALFDRGLPGEKSDVPAAIETLRA